MTEEEKQSRSLVKSAIMMLAAFILVTSFNILYTNRVNRDSDRLWCDLMVSLDDRYQVLETTDPDALRFKGQVRVLRQRLHCPPAKPISSSGGNK